jgi:hypothetical protein
VRRFSINNVIYLALFLCAGTNSLWWNTPLSLLKWRPTLLVHLHPRHHPWDRMLALFSACHVPVLLSRIHKILGEFRYTEPAWLEGHHHDPSEHPSTNIPFEIRPFNREDFDHLVQDFVAKCVTSVSDFDYMFLRIRGFLIELQLICKIQTEWRTIGRQTLHHTNTTRRASGMS